MAALSSKFSIDLGMIRTLMRVAQKFHEARAYAPLSVSLTVSRPPFRHRLLRI